MGYGDYDRLKQEASMRDKTDEYESRVARERDEMAIEDRVHVGYDTDPEPKLKYPDGNPKTQFGITKPRETYSPTIPMLEYGLAHLQGALKYGAFNWRDDPVTMSTYLDAATSHIKLFKEGQDRASDTDIHHLGHAMTCLSIIIDAQHYGSMIDDRWKPRDPNGPNAGDILEKYMEDNQARVKAIREKWTGFAEAQRAKKVPQKPKVSGFQQEMLDHPERAIGRNGTWNITGNAATYEVVKVEGRNWIIRDMRGAKFCVPFGDFTVDSGR